MHTPALAQLRTGRDTDREFYEAPESEKPAKVAKPTGSLNKRSSIQSEVVQASSNEVISTHHEPVRRDSNVNRTTKKQIASPVRHASGDGTSSRVVQAGCKSCQAGVAHSHGPIAEGSRHVATHVAQEPVYDESSTLSETIHDPDALVYGKSFEPCGSDCNSGIMIIRRI